MNAWLFRILDIGLRFFFSFFFFLERLVLQHSCMRRFVYNQEVVFPLVGRLFIGGRAHSGQAWDGG